MNARCSAFVIELLPLFLNSIPETFHVCCTSHCEDVQDEIVE